MSERSGRKTKDETEADKNDLIIFMKKTIEDDINNANNRMDTKNKTLEDRIEHIDEALRGNGRVGYSEQIRGMKRAIWVLTFAVIWLLGFEVGGVRLKDWLKGFFENGTPFHQIEEDHPVHQIEEDHPYPLDITPDHPQQP